MKLLLNSVLALALLASCNKKKEKEEKVSPDELNDPIANVQLPVVTPEQVSQQLAPNPDTLYVTNFFATWCGPCMNEIPHFKEKMEATKGQPIKFTFISLDDKADWDTEVKSFASNKGLIDNVELMDTTNMSPDFFKNNFKTWDGGSIPFTYMKKGNVTEEVVGSMSKEELDSKLAKFN